MAFPGWLTFAGAEVINIERVTTYAKALVPQLAVTPCDDCDDLHSILGQAEYTLPAEDNAPWYDAAVPDSHGFAGLYPLSVTGLDDDTREAEVTQSTFDGGYVGNLRRKTREVRVSGLLIGEDQGCVDYGLFWLRSLLDAEVRKAKIGRADPGSETMASIPDICSQEKGDIQFLAACPELGCGKHCGHTSSGKDVAHPVDLSTLKPTSGTYQQVGGQWTFTPASGVDELRTPLLPDTETCPVRYVWVLKEGSPGATATGMGVRDGKFTYQTDAELQYERLNLATNPQWKTTSGTVEVRRNLAINPSMRKLAPPNVTMTNRVVNPRGHTNTTGWILSSGTGGTSALTRASTGGPDTRSPSYVRQTWSAPQSGTTQQNFLGFGNLTGGTDELVVVAGERVFFSGAFRTSLSGQAYSARIWFYNASDTLLGTEHEGVTVAATANVWHHVEVSGIVPATATAARIVIQKVSGGLQQTNSKFDASAFIFIRNQHSSIAYFDGSSTSIGGQTYSWVGTAQASASNATGNINTIRTNTFVNPALTTTASYYSNIENGQGTITGTRELAPGLVLQGTTIPAFYRGKWTAITGGAPAGTGIFIGSTASLAIKVQANQPMAFSVYARSSHFDRTAQLTATYYDAVGIPIGAVDSGPETPIGGQGWSRLTVTTADVPIGAESVILRALGVGGSNWVLNDTMDVTAVLSEIGTLVQTYFDGSTPDTAGIDYAWSGGAAGTVPSEARSTVSGAEVVARINYALNPMQHASYPSGIITSSTPLYPLTQNAVQNRTLTTRTATSPSPTVSDVAVEGGTTTATQPAAPGETFTISVDVTTTAANRNWSAYISFLNAALVEVGTGTLRSGNIATAGSTSGPTRLWAIGTAPATTAWVRLRVNIATTSGNAPTNEVVYYDRLLVEKTSGLRPYFAGESISPSVSGLDPIWEGAAHMSRTIAVGSSITSTITGSPLWQSTARTPGGGYAASTFVTDGAGVLVTGASDTAAVATQFYSGRFQMRVIGVPYNAASQITVEAFFHDAGGASLGAAVASQTIAPTNDWQEISLLSSAAAPTNTASVRLKLTRTGTWSDNNARLELGDVLWERVVAIGNEAGRFFDGTFTDTVDLDFLWTGTADASASAVNGKKAVTGLQSTFPSVYQSIEHASSGYSVVLVGETSYVYPVYNTPPHLNGLTPGESTILSFDAYRESDGVVTASLSYKTVGDPDYYTIDTVFQSPLDGRYEAYADVPSDAESAAWVITNTTASNPTYISRVMIESDVTSAGEFFDGSMPPAVWNGTANASTSSLDPEPVVVLLPQGQFNDGLPSYSAITSEGQVVVDSVTAYYYDPETVSASSARYWRTLRQATCVSGPSVTREFAANSAVLKQVEFLITCPDPWAYGTTETAAVVVNGSATSTLPGVTVTSYNPGSVDLICYAEDIAYVPTDPNCGTIPRPPRPAPINPCGTITLNRGLLFFIPPSLLEESAGTYPTLVMKSQATSRDRVVVRCWPLPSASATLEDVSACDTRGWLTVGKIDANRGFILDCAAQRGTITNVPVTGGTLSLEATHFIYPPIAVPVVPGNPYDMIPLVWPEMYGGNYGYFLLVEYASTANMTCDLLLVTRR